MRWLMLLLMLCSVGCGMRASKVRYDRPDWLPEVTGKRIHIPPKSKERQYIPADYRDEGPVVDIKTSR